ncbi:MAG TPA: response regulator transcription factor [Marmoricola sp.]
MTAGMLGVVLVDDQDLVRDGFTMIVDSQPDMAVLGVAADGAEAIDVVRRTAPDVVLMDVRMPGIDGLAATRRLLGESTGSKVLMLTTFDLDEYVAEALRLGASGFLLKDSPRAHLLEAIRRVAQGELVLAPAVLARLVDSFVDRGARARDPRLKLLTPREVEVLGLVARGLSNAEIAAELFLGVTTVKSHVARLLGKLGLRDRVQAVVFAHETGLSGR